MTIKIPPVTSADRPAQIVEETRAFLDRWGPHTMPELQEFGVQLMALLDTVMVSMRIEAGEALERSLKKRFGR